MSKREVRTYRIGPEEEALVKAGAQREEIPPSTFVRRAALERAADVVRGDGDRQREGRTRADD